MRQFSITDAEVEELGRQALVIEDHYGRPMDIEWGKDGIDGKLYILQARPETVVSRVDGNVTRRFVLEQPGTVITIGRAIGQKIGAGPVRVMTSLAQMDQFHAGDVLVADMTDPDWEPIMKLASAIVTNRGRPHLSRGDHRPGTRHPRRRRHRRRDDHARERPRGDGLVRRG